MSSKKNLSKNPFKGSQANKYHSKKFSRLFTNLDQDETCFNSFKCTLIPKSSSTLINGRIYLTQCNIYFYSKAPESSFILRIRLSQIQSVRKERRKSKSAIKDTLQIFTETHVHEFTNFVLINNLYKPLKKYLAETQSNEQFEIIDDERNTPELVVIPTTTTTKTTSSKDDSNDSDNSTISFLSINKDDAIAATPTEDNHHQSKHIIDKEMIERNKLYDQTGKVSIDKEFETSAECLFYYLFDNNEFYNKFWGSRKFYGIKINNWESVNGYKQRKLEYLMEALGGSKVCKTIEEQKIVQYEAKKQIVLDSESFSEGVPYADAFSVRNRFILKYIDSNKCQLHITTIIFYAKKPNFIARAFIEKNCNSVMVDNFAALSSSVAQEIKNGIPSNYSNNFENSKYKPDNSSFKKRLLDYDDVKIIDDGDTCTISSLKNEYTDLDLNSKNDDINKISSTYQLTSTSSFSSDFSAFSTNRINITNILNRYNNPIAILAILLIILLLFLNLYVIFKLNKIEELTDTLTNCSNICTQISIKQQSKV